ncbi:MAG TPA: carboxypeptidase-like regulatory domain-containing protein [Bryobacteraceae bacterium]|nr:carboxypeptidase-like regulatory domain-containing protein [Bryobacteraceae bacterium]
MLASLLWLASPASPQNTSSGTISGQVTDPQGAAIPGAQVSLTDKTTSAVRTSLSNDTGRYDFFNLPPGVYDLAVTHAGFSETRLPQQKVDVGLVLTLNVSMQLGGTSSIIEVTASAGAELQTSNATVGSTVSGLQLNSLPNIGRDANAFILLQPGVAPTGNVAGTVNDQNGFQLDGGNNSSDMDGNMTQYTASSGTTTGATGGTPSGVIPTPIESIDEFKVSTANQTADFNGSAGGQVQMVTKRGTNDFHGAAYEYFLSSAVGANLWKNNHTPSGHLDYTPNPKTHQNRYGVAFGGPLTPRFWGGKTYFFVNYEGRRYPQSATVERTVPSQLLRDGIIQLPNSAGIYQAYNLNSSPVTVNGKTYMPATCGATLCDPRGLGLNPIVNQIWSKQMPLANDPQFGDSYNTQGYLANISVPQTSDNYTIRLDHDFGDKWHFMSSYRYFTFKQNTSNQYDIGGVLGGSLGSAVATAPRDQKPSYWVGGLTTTISPTLTNDVHYNYLRNFWQWGTDGAPPQLPGLGGAIEIGGESGGQNNALIPYNVNTQNVRQRFWDGQDNSVRDDLSWVKGNHLLQFGGSYQRNWDFHQRDDNGAGIFNNTVYQVGGALSGISFGPANIPASLPSNQVSNWENLYTEVLGIVSQPQTLYTRAGSNLSLQPLGTNLFDQVTIPYYNLYFSDTWHIRSDLSLTYGLGYQIEMPPTEAQGKQTMLVYQNGNQIGAEAYLQAKEAAALQGQVDNPNVGFALIGNVAGHPKYPYNPFYGGLSPRTALAWNPSFTDGLLGHVFGQNKTVLRGGWSRIYGRLNGVNQVLVPLLGTSISQPVQCIGASTAGACLGSGGVTPTTAFRIGTDGLVAPLPAVTSTLAQPYYPGQNSNAAAGDGTVIDQNFKPDRSDVFDFTIQRQLSNKLSFELGYIGRIIRNEFQLINLDAVPTMMTLNGQSFANAFANVYGEVAAGQAVQTQPFLESVMGGPNSAYCKGYSSCTAAIASKQKTQITGTQVYNLWTNLSKTSSWTLGRTLPDSAPAQTASLYEATSLGYGNYNGAFATFTIRDWHNLTAASNFTWSRALGTVSQAQSTSSTTVLDPWNLQTMYGPQPFDIRFVYNLSVVYSPHWLEGHRYLYPVLGGWNFAPLFTAQSGVPLEVSIGSGTTNCQSFGESNCSSDSTFENAVLTAPYTQGNSVHQNVTSSTTVASAGNASKGGSGLNIFGNPSAALSDFRRLILGVDTTSGGAGVLRGFPTWNLDMAISKDFKIPIREGMGLTFNAQFSNMLNHFQAANPTLNIDSPTTWGVVTTQANTPRQIEFGLRLHF